MLKVIVFGAGKFGKRFANKLGDQFEIIAFADNNFQSLRNSGRDAILGHALISPDQIRDFNYDKIVIAIDDNKPIGIRYVDEILQQLDDLKVLREKIWIMPLYQTPKRVDFIKKLSLIIHENNIPGAVIECGVRRGFFAGYINNYFSDRKLYLCDTFSGFASEDIKKEAENTDMDWVDKAIDRHKQTSENIAMLHCLYPNMVEIRKGFVPDTLTGLEAERFAFVNLDMDLYAPTLSSLKFFVPRLSLGGVILIHDYYHPALPGVKKAVDEFAKEQKITQMPIGDNCSIVIVPQN